MWQQKINKFALIHILIFFISVDEVKALLHIGTG